jgi:hypothetical protein
MDAQLCMSARSASDIIHRMSSVDSDRGRLRAELLFAAAMMSALWVTKMGPTYIHHVVYCNCAIGGRRGGMPAAPRFMAKNQSVLQALTNDSPDALVRWTALV